MAAACGKHPSELASWCSKCHADRAKTDPSNKGGNQGKGGGKK